MPGLFERLLRAALGPLMPRVAADSALDADPMEHRPGVHLLHAMGAEHEFFAEAVDATTVVAAVRSVDWEHEFSQVFAVVRPGAWLEVGGSLSEDHGLSVMYVDRGAGIASLLDPPPDSVAGMEEVMLAFLDSGEALLRDPAFSWNRLG